MHWARRQRPSFGFRSRVACRRLAESRPLNYKTRMADQNAINLRIIIERPVVGVLHSLKPRTGRLSIRKARVKASR